MNECLVIQKAKTLQIVEIFKVWFLFVYGDIGKVWKHIGKTRMAMPVQAQLFRAQLGASTAQGLGALWQPPRLWGNGEACSPSVVVIYSRP